MISGGFQNSQVTLYFGLKTISTRNLGGKQIVEEVIHKKVIDLKYAEYFVGRNPNCPLVLKLM